jgi:hypothetical protein
MARRPSNARWPTVRSSLALVIDAHRSQQLGEFKVVQKETIASSLEKVPGGLAVVPGETRNMVITPGDWLAGSDQAVMPFDQGAF